MAKQRNRKPVRRRDKKGFGGTGRRKPCPFCKDKIEQVDYKDAGGLRRFLETRFLRGFGRRFARLVGGGKIGAAVV